MRQQVSSLAIWTPESEKQDHGGPLEWIALEVGVSAECKPLEAVARPLSSVD